jgi:hypothetical protein
MKKKKRTVKNKPRPAKIVRHYRRIIIDIPSDTPVVRQDHLVLDQCNISVKHECQPITRWPGVYPATFAVGPSTVSLTAIIVRSSVTAIDPIKEVSTL